MEINKAASLLFICCLSLSMTGCGGSDGSTEQPVDEQQNNDGGSENNGDDENGDNGSGDDNTTNTTPSLSLLDGKNPTYAVTERTTLRVPFEVQDTDTNIEDMDFSISIGSDNNPNFTYEYSVDMENSILNIQFGSFNFYPSSSNYTTFSVSDGVDSVEESFSLVLNSLVVTDYISLSGQSVFANVNYDIDFVVRTKDIEEFQIYDVKYINSIYDSTDPLNISYDLTNKVFSLNCVF